MCIRDSIKPDNVIVKINKNNTYTAVMVDFGEAKYHIQAASTKVGTNEYMAPEIYFMKPYTDLCDSWSLG